MKGCTSHSYLLPVWSVRRVADVRIALKKPDQDSRTRDKVQRWPVIDPPLVVEVYFDVWRNGDDVLVEQNEIYANLTPAIGVDDAWEGGGTKFAQTSRLTVRGNSVHDNYGSGLWTDIDNIDALCERHHVLRHTHGWRKEQRDDGTLVWVTPAGREYLIKREPVDPRIM